MSKKLEQRLLEIQNNPDYNDEQKGFHSRIVTSLDKLDDISDKMDKHWVKKLAYWKENDPNKFKKMEPMVRKHLESRKKQRSEND